MNKAKWIYNATLGTQSAYYLLTAIWPLVNIESFMLVTGPKEDIWLVKTVSVLLLPVSLVFAAAIFTKTPILIITLLSAGCAAGLAIIDFYYTGNGTISMVYQIDGYVQIFFLLAWVYILIQKKAK